jgi:hypothetical protein
MSCSERDLVVQSMSYTVPGNTERNGRVSFVGTPALIFLRLYIISVRMTYNQVRTGYLVQMH